MKLKTIMLATAASVAFTGPVFSADMAPCENCADELTVVSWGGAYQNSQIKAYSEPYAEKTGVTFIWDESSNEAVAKLRAMNEAGNITWDLVDVEGPDAVRLCDEGLAAEVDHRHHGAGRRWLEPASDDFGSSLVSECFIPQIVFSTTFGYRTNVDAWGGATPTSLCDIFDHREVPGQAGA